MNVIRECSSPDCRFRYPEIDVSHPKAFCPKCGQPANIAIELPDKSVTGLERHVKGFSNDFRAVLDNIRSLYNVGSIFRTADGFGVNQLLLCGITPTPQNPRFSKTSLGAENFVDWEHQPNALLACGVLKKNGYKIISLEISDQSTNLYAVDKKIMDSSIALVVGNEVTGVDPGILEISDRIISIPMNGYKNSHNVAISFGIAVSYFYALSSR